MSIEAAKVKLATLLEQKLTWAKTHQLLLYQPYLKQVAFHESGARFRERLFMAGNQLGKTLSGGAEVSMHAIGLYPEWWTGKRLPRANSWWVAGVSGESTRDNPQRILLGPVGSWGQGMIPKDSIEDIRMGRGVADAVDTIIIKHRLGGVSFIHLKSYEKGREKWQGMTLTGGLWFDEEPPLDVYIEGLTRTNAHQAMVFITFTPLLGMSDVVLRYLSPGDNDTARSVTTMTIDDVGHYSAESKAAIIASYPLHEREARTKGVPLLGSGRVFPVVEALLVEDPLEIPRHWPRICGLDFGWDHPTAAVWLAWDRDTDTIHVYDAYRQAEATPIVHAAAIKGRGAWVPVAWPHDGLQHDKGSGEELANLYRVQGVNMAHERAQYVDDRGSGLEAGIMDVLQRMQTGRFKIARHLHEWWEEFRMYHRKEGRVVKQRDDLMSATRYAVMMLRYACTQTTWAYHTGPIKYRNQGIV